MAGHSDNVQLNLKGDLTQFPFEQGNGVFRVDAQVRDAVIDYVPGWPRIEGIQARVLFQGKTMEVTSSQARIYGVALSPVKAVIPDLIHHEEQLTCRRRGQRSDPGFHPLCQLQPGGRTPARFHRCDWTAAGR